MKEFASQLNVQPNWMLVAGVACMAAGTLLFLVGDPLAGWGTAASPAGCTLH